MKGLLKNLGLLLILVGVIILIACSLTGEVNNNAVLGRLDSIGGTRTDYLYCDKQKNCRLIVSARNKKAGKRMFSGFFISIHSPIHYDSGSGVINL